MGRSKGRHRAPSTAAVTATRFAAVGATSLAPVALLAPTAVAVEVEPASVTGTLPAVPVVPLVDWTPIIKCESGGSPTATNPRSTASGLLQFLDGSWKHYGGTKYAKRAKDATPAQQIEIGNVAYAQDGLTPWVSSKDCWGRQEKAIKTGTTPGQAPPPAPAPPAAPAPAPAPAPPGMQLGQRDEHGRGFYTCDDAHLRFELCDPNTRGQVFQYPVYAGHNVPPLAGGPAVAPMAHTAPIPAPAASAPAAQRGARIIATARTWAGVRYVWGGTTRSGVDCSGLVLNVFRANGIKPPRTANEQMRWAKRINRADARPGDLAFRVKGGRAYHVGIVVGNGRYIESPQPGSRVKESPIPAGAVFGRIPT